MNFLDLQYFIAVAEDLSFTKAAKALFITQQTLSEHIKKLEENLGTKLFLRTNPLTLTASGNYLYDKAKEMLLLKDNISQEITDIDDFKNSILTIGCTHTRTRFLLPAAIKNFYQKYPHIKLKLFEGTSPEVEEQLLNGKLDFSIGFIPEYTTDIKSIPLYDEHFVVVVPISLLKNNRNGKYGEIIRQLDTKFEIQLLSKCPFISMTLNTKLGKIFSMYTQQCNFKPRIIFETPNIETMIAFSQQEIGVIFCPETFIRYAGYNKENFKFYTLTTGAFSMRSIAVNFNTNRYTSLAAQKFIETLQEVLKDEFNY